MSDPLSEIEERRGQIDLGRTGYRMYLGAREEGASKREAFLVTTAWFLAMLEANQEGE